jgi:hypothetical protein
MQGTATHYQGRLSLRWAVEARQAPPGGCAGRGGRAGRPPGRLLQATPRRPARRSRTAALRAEHLPATHRHDGFAGRVRVRARPTCHSLKNLRVVCTPCACACVGAEAAFVPRRGIASPPAARCPRLASCPCIALSRPRHGAGALHMPWTFRGRTPPLSQGLGAAIHTRGHMPRTAPHRRAPSQAPPPWLAAAPAPPSPRSISGRRPTHLPRRPARPPAAGHLPPARLARAAPVPFLRRPAHSFPCLGHPYPYARRPHPSGAHPIPSTHGRPLPAITLKSHLTCGRRGLLSALISLRPMPSAHALSPCPQPMPSAHPCLEHTLRADPPKGAHRRAA